MHCLSGSLRENSFSLWSCFSCDCCMENISAVGVTGDGRNLNVMPQNVFYLIIFPVHFDFRMDPVRRLLKPHGKLPQQCM